MTDYSNLPPIYEVGHMNREELIAALISVYGGEYYDYEVYSTPHLSEQVNDLNSSIMSMLVSPEESV